VHGKERHAAALARAVGRHYMGEGGGVLAVQPVAIGGEMLVEGHVVRVRAGAEAAGEQSEIGIAALAILHRHRLEEAGINQRAVPEGLPVGGIGVETAFDGAERLLAARLEDRQELGRDHMARADVGDRGGLLVKNLVQPRPHLADLPAVSLAEAIAEHQVNAAPDRLVPGHGLPVEIEVALFPAGKVRMIGAAERHGGEGATRHHGLLVRPEPCRQRFQLGQHGDQRIEEAAIDPFEPDRIDERGPYRNEQRLLAGPPGGFQRACQERAGAHRIDAEERQAMPVAKRHAFIPHGLGHGIERREQDAEFAAFLHCRSVRGDGRAQCLPCAGGGEQQQPVAGLAALDQRLAGAGA